MSTYQMGPLRVEMSSEGPYHTAKAYFVTPDGGDVMIVARAHEGAIRYLLPRTIGEASPDEMAGIFDFVKKIARSKVFRSVVNTAASVMSHPAFSLVAAAIPGVGPGIAVAGQFAGHAAKMALKATAGSPKARARVARLASDAARGIPQAKKEYAAYQGIVSAHAAAAKAGPRAKQAFEAALRTAAKSPKAEPVAYRLPPLDLVPSEDEAQAFELPAYEDEGGMVLGYMMPGIGCI